MAALQRGERLRAAVRRAGDGEAPVAVRKRAERTHENVVGLARHDRADRQQLHGAARCRVARGAGSVPGSATVILSRRHGEVRAPACAPSSGW